MAQNLYNLKSKDDNHNEASLIYSSFEHFGDTVKQMPTLTNKKEGMKKLGIIKKDLGFNEQNQQRCGLNI